MDLHFEGQKCISKLFIHLFIYLFVHLFVCIYCIHLFICLIKLLSLNYLVVFRCTCV